MKIRRCLLAILPAVLCCSVSQAQFLQKPQDPITLEPDFDQRTGEFVVNVTKRVLGNYSIAVEFVSPQNLLPPAHFRASVRGSGTLIRLKPTQTDRPGWSALRFSYILGVNNARVDHGFVYRLPYAETCGTVRADTAFSIDAEYFKDARPKNWKAYYFKLNEGDTVYAARKGRVVAVDDSHGVSEGVQYASRSNAVRVEHADGSIAVYQVLEQGSAMVREGQMVYPDTPLARVGSFDGQSYKLAFFVYYIENAPLEQGNQYNVTRAFTSAFVDPVFASGQGDIKLQSGHTYESKPSRAVITAEMSKKEIKKIDSH